MLLEHVPEDFKAYNELINYKALTLTLTLTLTRPKILFTPLRRPGDNPDFSKPKPKPDWTQAVTQNGDAIDFVHENFKDLQKFIDAAQATRLFCLLACLLVCFAAYLIME